jgi:hypothetical protein
MALVGDPGRWDLTFRLRFGGLTREDAGFLGGWRAAGAVKFRLRYVQLINEVAQNCASFFCGLGSRRREAHEARAFGVFEALDDIFEQNLRTG